MTVTAPVGDLLVTLRVTLPEKIDPDFELLIRKWVSQSPDDSPQGQRQAQRWIKGRRPPRPPRKPCSPTPGHSLKNSFVGVMIATDWAGTAESGRKPPQRRSAPLTPSRANPRWAGSR